MTRGLRSVVLALVAVAATIVLNAPAAGSASNVGDAAASEAAASAMAPTPAARSGASAGFDRRDAVRGHPDRRLDPRPIGVIPTTDVALRISGSSEIESTVSTWNGGVTTTTRSRAPPAEPSSLQG